jgi:hypothetical protein
MALEGRTLLSTITVTSRADTTDPNGDRTPGTLRPESCRPAPYAMTDWVRSRGSLLALVAILAVVAAECAWRSARLSARQNFQVLIEYHEGVAAYWRGMARRSATDRPHLRGFRAEFQRSAEWHVRMSKQLRGLWRTADYYSQAQLQSAWLQWLSDNRLQERWDQAQRMGALTADAPPRAAIASRTMPEDGP